MDKPDWTKTLEILYDENITVYEATEDSLEIHSKVLNIPVNKSEFEESEIFDHLRYLRAMNLIDLNIHTRNENRDERMALVGLHKKAYS